MRLKEVLQRTDVFRANMHMLNYMATIFADYPVQSLDFINLFIDKNTDPWFFRMTRRQRGAWTILEQAVKSEAPEIKGKAIDILNLLGSKGYLEFRELVPKG